MSEQTPMLEAISITKRFGDFTANDQVSLSVAPGEIHALLGENGAGKSTLVKTFLGVHRPDAGELRWEGAQVSIPSPNFARRLGVGMVFQHFALFDALTAAENIALALPREWSVARVTQRLAEVCDKYGLKISPSALIADLSAGERQRIEIVRCLMLEPKLIILDEPTSVLTPQEAEALFDMLRALKAEGRAILYISHKLDEVRALCERATILRHGAVVASCDPREASKAELARLMVGETVHAAKPAGAAPDGAEAICVEGLWAPAPSLFGVALENISFTLRSGQIRAIAGIAGNGQTELFNALSGERLSQKPQTIRFHGQNVGRAGVVERRRLDAEFVSEERLGHGAAPDFSLSENVLLTRGRTGEGLVCAGFIKKALASALAQKIRKKFDVRSADTDPPARALSGGNLQKFIIGRAVDRAPKILVINQPTWGVDAGAAANIRKTLVKLAQNGAAVLVISQDLDEIFEVADQIAVISAGRLSDFEPAAQMSPERIGLLMSEAGAADAA